MYSRTTTKSIPLLQLEHEFCQQNGSQRGQLQDWYPDGKMMVVPVCWNGRCINKDFGRVWNNAIPKLRDLFPFETCHLQGLTLCKIKLCISFHKITEFRIRKEL